jgi:integrase
LHWEVFHILHAKKEKMMGVKIRINRGKIYLDIHVNGKRTWESLHLSVSSDKKQNKEIMHLAEICRSKREAQITSGEWGLLDPIEGKRSLYSYMEELGKNLDKKAQVNKCLKYLKEYQGGNIAIGQVTEKWIEDFQIYLLRDTELSKITANRYSSAIRFALRKATRDRIIPRNPAEGVRAIPIPESDKVFLTPEEIQRLAQTDLGGSLGAEIKRAFLFGCFTGLRISDLKSLVWGDVIREPLQIAKRQEKTDRKVFIPLHVTAWGIINDGAIHNHKEIIFPELTKTKTNTNQYLITWAKRSGLEKQIGWHTARHTAAVLLLEGGAEIYTVSKLLGHTNLKTTQVYAKATDKMKREAVNGLPKIKIE